ncbi:hypothetical protein ACJIZ3_013952 [Penstemon smallii]|uniref:NAC domain-containing protein n=1 Tax=Penstemon smallii TaxID=265156 RepID=A0ABD3RIW0_9LAMI
MHHQQVQNHYGNTNSPIEIVYVKDFPPGYRFQPTDDELIVDYLKKKVENEPIPYSKIHEVDIYKHNPKELSENFSPFGEKKWYFFTPRDRKYLNGSRPNRAAGHGYWKATVGDKAIYHNDKIVGSKRSLVFYEGKPPKAKKTNWLMQEYMVHEPKPKRNSTSDAKLDNWVLCRIYKRDGKKDKDSDLDRQPNENFANMACHNNIDMGQSNGLMKRLGIDHTSTFPNIFANSNQSGWGDSIIPPIYLMESGFEKENGDLSREGFHATGGDEKKDESTESITAQFEPPSNVDMNTYIDFNDPIFSDIALDVDQLLV